MKTLFFKRSGERIAASKIKASQDSYANSFLTGEGIAGKGSRSINLRLAARWASMSLIEFCRESGAFTYKKI